MTDRKRLSLPPALGPKQAGVYYALLLLVAGMSVLTAAMGLPPYLSAANLGNIAYHATLVGFVSIGMTVLLIAGAFDLSVASVAALAAAVMVGLAGKLGVPLALGAALCAAATVGIFNALVVELVGINAFIVTLATLTAVRGLVLVMTDGRSLMVEDPQVLARMLAIDSMRIRADLPLGLIGLGLVVAGAAWRRWLLALAGVGAGALGLLFLGATLAAPVVYLALAGLVAAGVMHATVIGRRLQAVGANAEAARLSGVPVRACRIGAFVFTSVMAGVAGVLFACRLGSVNPTALGGMELTVIAAAILGGTSLYGGSGSVAKTLAGAFLLFALTNGFNMLNIGANYQGIIEGAVIIVAAAIYSVGHRGNGPRGRLGAGQ